MENEGIEYLRSQLHLPPEIVPSTLKRAARTETARARPSAAPRTGDSKVGADRQQYRRAPLEGADKKADVGAGAADVEFVSIKRYFGVGYNRSWQQLTFCKFVSLQHGGFGRGSKPQ